MNVQPITVQKIFNLPVEVVWKAITDKDQMIQWFFDNIPDFKAEKGFKIQFLVENEGRQFTHLWEIIEVIPTKKIVYDWRYQEYNGVGMVSFEISDENGISELTITNLGIESFPQDIPEFKRESCESGWNYFINRLYSYLNS